MLLLFLSFVHAFYIQHSEGKGFYALDSSVKGYQLGNLHTFDKEEKRFRSASPEGNYKEIHRLGVESVIILSTHKEDKHRQEIKALKNLGISDVAHIVFPWKDAEQDQSLCESALATVKLLAQKQNKTLLHCTAGEDRSGLIAGLYRVLIEKQDPSMVFNKEMCERGFANANASKPKAVAEKVKNYLLPLYFYLASKQSLDKSVCENYDRLQVLKSDKIRYCEDAIVKPSKKVANMKLYEIPVKTINGEETTLAPFKGKTMVFVNLASKCGFTPQYEGLEKIYQEYKDQGLVVLGFPCNQFGGQEPGTEEEIQEFCKVNYGVSFPLFAKIEVNGDDAHPIYKYLKSEMSGIFGTEAVKWNFTKFVVDKDGKPFKRFSPQTSPEEMMKEVQKIL
mgnify:CR=1 FL=1|tara:strand:- start:6105 stop:7283 length:1179 start_codon:yes stop_codon:yes gene_type:complete